MMVYVPVRALRIALVLALLIAFGVVTSTGGALAQEEPLVSKGSSQSEGGMVGKLAGPKLGVAGEDLGIAEADLGVSKVIGADDRIRVTPTTGLPARTIAMLDIDFGGQHYMCTGTFIGPDVLITAAHCLYDTEAKVWYDTLKVIPGRDGATMPFGSQYADDAYVRTAWTTDGNIKDDYGFIIMPSTQLGNTVGWQRLSQLSEYSLRSVNLTPVIAGYPGDKVYGQQWSAHQSSLLLYDANLLAYTIDTYGGQSGSSVRRGSDNAVFGVHSSGGANYNIGVRVTPTMINTAQSVCNQLGCTVHTYVEPDPVFTKKVFLPLVVR